MKSLIRVLRTPEPADGGASDAHGVFDGSDDPGDDGSQQAAAEQEGGTDEGEQQGVEGATEGAQAAGAATPEQIAQIVAGVMQGHQPQQTQQQPARELTQEEFDQRFHMARVKAEAFQELRTLLSQDTPEALAKGAKILEDLLQAGAKQAIVMNSFQLQELKDELLGIVNPLRESFQSQQVEKLRSEFYTAHKDLEQWAPVVEAITQRLTGEGKLKGLDKTKAFKLVSDETRKVIKGLPVQQASAGADGRPVTQQQSRTSRMSTLTRGGQGGGQSSGQQGGGKKSAGHAVFS